VRPSPGTYTRDDIEKLLMALFNGGIKIREDYAPDDDMPRAAGNAARGNSFAAELIDAKNAWLWAVVGQRLYSPEAVFLHYGEGMDHHRIGLALGTPRTTVIDRITADIGLLADAASKGLRA